MYEPPQSALHRANDLASLGRAARRIGLGATLAKPVSVLPEDASSARLDWYLKRLPEVSPTLEDLLGEGPVGAEARRLLPSRERRALVDRVRAYLLTAVESGIVTAPGPSDPPTTDAKALVEWAGHERLSGFVRGQLGALGLLGEVPPNFAYQAQSLGLGSLAEALFAHRRPWSRSQAPRAAQVAREAMALLHLELDRARARPVTPPVPALPHHPTLRRLAERLHQLRATVAASNDGPARPWTVDIKLTHDSTALICILSEGQGRRGVAQVLSLSGEAGFTCDCLGRDASCRHVLAAIDVLLAAFVDPVNPQVRERVLAALRRPWERALAKLEAIAGAATLGRAPVETEWRLRKGKQGIKLSPCVIEGKRSRSLQFYEVRGDGWTSLDRTVASLFDLYRSHYQSTARLASALELLAHDPRLRYADRKISRPIVVTTARAELRAVEWEGGLRFSLALDGYVLSDDDLDGINSEDGAVVVIDSERPEPAPVRVLIGRLEPGLVAAWEAVEETSVLPAEAVERLQLFAPRLAQAMPVRLPESMLGKAIPAAPRAVLRVGVLADDTLAVDALVRVVAGAQGFPPGEGPRDVFLVRDGERCHARREVETEVAWLRHHLEPLALPAGSSWRLVGDDALDLLSRLDQAEVRRDLDIEWDKGRLQVVSQGHLRVEVRERRDWFALSGGLDVGDEQVSLAALLAALNAGRRYVEVGDGRWTPISEQLRARLAGVADLTAASGATLEIPAMAAPLLEAQLGDALVQPPLRWRELVSRAEAAASAPPTPLPALGLVLRDYQQAGFDWLSRLAIWGAGACLADDMGLGKTIQALAVLAARRELGPALVVAPTSVGWNWLREAERCTPGLRFHLFSQSEREAILAEAGAGDVIVVSYGLLVRHAEAFAARRFATLVFDEAHALKNPLTRRTQAAAAVVADFKIALTGTPLENRLSELWSLFRIVVPGLLGGLDRFRERFAAPIEREGDAGRRAALARLVRPFLLRRLKHDVARELPSRTEVQVDVTLTRSERSVYDAVRVQAAQALAGEGDGDKRFAVLAALTRLRQAACDAGLVDPSFATLSSKLSRLVELVDELRAEGHRVLVFSQFTSLLTRARDAVAASGATCLYLDGATPEVRRRELVDAFQAGRGEAFFISLKAGGAGLNLTGADNVIHLDPWWNPAVEDQATDRAHRIGQQRPVTVYRLVAAGTVEDAILRLHADKRALVAGVLEGSGAAGALDASQLAALLQPSREAAGEGDGEGEGEGSELEVEVETAAVPAVGRPSDLTARFAEHLRHAGAAASTAAAYTSRAARWLAGRPSGEEAAATALAARRSATDIRLPKTDRYALARLASMLEGN